MHKILLALCLCWIPLGLADEKSDEPKWLSEIAEAMAAQDAARMVEQKLAPLREELKRAEEEIAAVNAEIKAATDIKNSNEAESVKTLAETTLKSAQLRLTRIEKEADGLRKKHDTEKATAPEAAILKPAYHAALKKIRAQFENMSRDQHIDSFVQDVKDVRLKAVYTEWALDQTVRYGLYLWTKLERVLNSPEMCKIIENCPERKEPVPIHRLFYGTHADSLEKQILNPKKAGH